MRVVRRDRLSPDEIAQAEARARIEASLRERGELLPWHDIGAAGEPGFQNSFSDYDGSHPLLFRKHHFGWVEFRGMVKSTASGRLTVFTLPVGFRPAVGTDLPGYWRSTTPGVELGQFVTVQTDGQVLVGIAGRVTAQAVLDQVAFATDA